MAETPELTVAIVSYNTRELTLTAIRTLVDNSPGVSMHIVVLDNDSRDGSADAIAEHFPQVELIRSPDNLGFALANNRIAEQVTTPWFLLLNPDTETYPGSIANLLAFAKANPRAGITGGRTYFPDGSLNAASCYQRLTPWNLFCAASGLAKAAPNSPLFNAEAMGGWRRDSVRHVDIVVGCFLMIPTALWRELGGFDTSFFMYGEEADLCLRARKLGYRPMITPDATIMHLVGASTSNKGTKQVAVMKAKTTLMRRHWPAWQQPIGTALLWMWVATRKLGSVVKSRGKTDPRSLDRWRMVWDQRSDWMRGYGPSQHAKP